MPYQQVNGSPNYEVLLKVPLEDRVPGLAAKYGEEKIHALIVLMLTEFVGCFNLVRTMTSDQIVSCAYDLMLSTREDFLSLEDIALFFKQAKNGVYGKVYEGLDQVKIFEMLERYRKERTESYYRAKYEQEQQYKALPINDRISDMFTSTRDKTREANIGYLKTKAK